MRARCTCTRTHRLHQDPGTRTPTGPGRAKRALGSPVVPLVYMMVHRSPGAGGDAGAGAAAPASKNAAHVRVSMPAALHAWARPGRAGSLSPDPLSEGPVGANQALVAVLERRQDLATQTRGCLSASRVCSGGVETERVARLLESGVLGRAGAPVDDGAQLPALQLRQRLGERGQLVGRRKQRGRLRVRDDEVHRVLAQRVIQRHAEERLPVARLRRARPPVKVSKQYPAS
jgi:hypothetical protein